MALTYRSSKGSPLTSDEVDENFLTLSEEIDNLDGLVVHLAGTETITGQKTFSLDIVSADTKGLTWASGSYLKDNAGNLEVKSTSIKLYDTTFKKALEVGVTNDLRIGEGFDDAVIYPTTSAIMGVGSTTLSVTSTLVNISATGNITATSGNEINFVSAGKISFSSTINDYRFAGASGIEIFDLSLLSTTRTLTFPDATGTLALTANKLSAFAATTSAELAGVISDETGSGALVFADTPTLVTPILGTPTSGNLANCTGLPFSGLAALTSGNILVGNGSNVAASVAMSGHATLSNAGVLTLDDSVRSYTTKVSVSSAEILALNSSPKQLLAAPGSGKLYEITGILCRMNFGTAAYAANTTLQVLYSGANLVVGTNSNIINATISKTGKMILSAISAAGSTQYLENTALNVNVGGGNPTTGDGTLDIYITYKIITL
jgi:hypothetical protein